MSGLEASKSVGAPVPRRANVAPAPAAMIRTKLMPPRLPANPVAKARHLLWIEPILTHSLCTVRAPSGYGKSTLCTGWYQALASKNFAVGWVSFERDDDDPARAISYIFEAVRAAGLDPDLIYDGLTPPQSLATHLVNAVHDFGKPLILFLDDLDRLTDPRILQFINFILLHCPDNLHIVCACQAYPALPLVFLDTHAMLLRVGAEELRLTDNEARTLLAVSGNLLSEADIVRLNEAMAGWVTGLRIGSAALRNNRDALFDIGLVSHGAHWLSDYLDENIFQHLNAVTRRFLMRCAVVETMTADLCTALSGETSAAQMLAWLADQNLFIQRLDDAGTRFRIHPVFREFLLARLAAASPGSLREVHRAASDWFAAHDRTAEAIGHAFDAEETGRAAALIGRAAMAMVEHSDIVMLLGWIARLPEDAIADHLSLHIAEAWALTLSLRPQARGLIDQLGQQVRRVSDVQERQRLTLELAGLETIFLSVYEDRIDAALVSGYAFLEASDDDDSFVARAVRNATAYCEINRGNMHLVHDLVRPAQLSALRNEQLFPTAYRYCIIGLSFRMQGALAEAERTFLSGLALAEGRGGRQSASSGLLAAFAARSLYERGDLSGAAALLRDRLPVIDEAAFHEAVIDAYIVLIRIAGAQRKKDEAAALIERAELIGHERNWRRLLAVCVLERVRLGLSLTTDTQRLVPHSMCLAFTTDLLSLEMRTYAIVAEALALSAVLTDDFAEADRHREWLFRYACVAKNDPLLLRVALMKIVNDASQNPAFELDADDAMMLGRAMAKGYRRTILDGLAPLGDLRIRGLLAGDEGLNDLLACFVGDEGGATQADMGRSGTVFSILTSREIDVLTGVSRGDSNKEIARRLHLTPETVKWHLKNVMRKLHAESRAEAVDNAAALGLSLVVA